MQSFQTHQGLNSFIKRLELEVDHCRKQQPFQIQVGPVRRDSLADAMEQAEEEAAAAARGIFLTCNSSLNFKLVNSCLHLSIIV